MPTILRPIITNAGLAAAQAQDGLGLELEITHVQLGAGTYTLDETEGSADYNRTNLVNPIETVPIAGGHVMDKGFRVDALFPAWVDGVYGASEIGFWAGSPSSGGVLFALWAQPAAFTQRNNIEYLASFAVGLARVPDGSVTVTFDPDLQKAIALMTYHEVAADPHPQYVKRAGDTMLGALNLVEPAQFDNSFKGVPSQWVRKHLGMLRGETTANSATVLGVAHIGTEVFLSGVGGYAVTLPLIANAPAGSTLFVVCGSSFPVTVQRQGANVISTGSVQVSNVSMGPGDTAYFVSNGASWVLFGGSVSLRYAAAFGYSFGADGWAKQPNGLIMQWGRPDMGAGTSLSVAFPLAFPNACLACVPVDWGSSASMHCYTAPTATHGFFASNVNAGIFNYLAVGY